MRRVVFITVLCAFIAVPTMADMVKPTGTDPDGGLQGYGPWQAGSGGEFSLLPSGWSYNPLLYYADSTKNQGTTGTFQSFCIEYLQPEYLYAETWHASVLNDHAIMGSNPLSGDPLSVGAAYLYYKFATGNLTGYNYSNTGVGREASALELQNALWWLEGEIDLYPTTNIFAKAVVDLFGAAAIADNNGQYNVAIMNLWVPDHIGDFSKDANGNYLYLRQDQLVLVPVPAAVLLGLLGLGVAGIKLRKYT